MHSYGNIIYSEKHFTALLSIFAYQMLLVLLNQSWLEIVVTISLLIYIYI